MLSSPTPYAPDPTGSETVVVTEKEFLKARNSFLNSGLRIISAPADEEELTAIVLKERARAVIVGVERYEKSLYLALKETGGDRGSILARFGVGHDGIDKTAARQNGVIVCNTPGALDISVAELTIGLLVNLVRRISRCDIRMRCGEFFGVTGRELHGMRLGILGFGNIGRRVARIAHFGFGMKVRAVGASSPAQLEAREKCGLQEFQEKHGLENYSNDAEALLRESDVVSLHLPATPETLKFINPDRLQLLAPTALLINTARGNLVDESALYDALVSERLAGAALDVFEREPYVANRPAKDLRTLPNVVLTPHVGSNTQEANQRMAEACIANVSHFFRGEFSHITQINEGKLPGPANPHSNLEMAISN